MTTITIKQYGDVVYFLTAYGFRKGRIVHTSVISNGSHSVDIGYNVKEDGDNTAFSGYCKKPSEIWDDKDSMLKHYQDAMPI